MTTTATATIKCSGCSMEMANCEFSNHVGGGECPMKLPAWYLADGSIEEYEAFEARCDEFKGRCRELAEATGRPLADVATQLRPLYLQGPVAS